MIFRFQKSIKQLMFLAILNLLVACGTFQVGIEPGVTPVPETPTAATLAMPIPTEAQEAVSEPATSIEQPEPLPTQTPITNQELGVQQTPEESRPAPYWVAYRDAEYGYGLALPCNWVTYSAHGLSTRSYDEDFAMANSIRSQWKEGVPPARAFNPDIGVFEYRDSGIAANTPIREAVPQLIDDDIAGMEDVFLGSHTALLVHLEGKDTPDYFANKLFFFQLSPDRLLMFAPKWQNAMESPDVQAILASISLSPEEAVQLPTIPPAGPVEGRQVYINQEAGYCLQYPSEFTLEEFRSGQPLTMGPVLTLKVERPLYTVGLTVEVQPVSADLSLAQSVDRFMDQFAGEPSLSIKRNPVELVGGVEYQLAGEPAELLEEVPGPEGSRDIFAIHENRLYHLIFSPSFLNNPQATQDVNLLYNVISSSFTFLPLGE